MIMGGCRSWLSHPIKLQGESAHSCINMDKLTFRYNIQPGGRNPHSILPGYLSVFHRAFPSSH